MYEIQDEYSYAVGWDWADTKHDVKILDTESGKRRAEVIGSSPGEIDEWILKNFRTKKVAIAIEQKRGATINMLLKYKNITIFPVNPASLDSYRKTFSPSGSKNDPKDAGLLLDLLEKHHDRLEILTPDDTEIRMLNDLNKYRRKCVDQRCDLTNELKALLKSYFPQALGMTSRIYSKMFLDMLMTWPTLEALKKTKKSVLRKFFIGHRLRNPKHINKKIEIINNSILLTDDKAIIKPKVLRVKVIVSQLRALNKSVKKYDKEINNIFSNHKQKPIFDSLPGAGDAYAPRLLCVFGSNKENFSSAAEVSTLAGVAPVKESSGKKSWVHWRWNAPVFMRQTLVEFAGQSVVYCKWARIFYNGKKKEGKNRNAILRALAFKWVRIIYSCWKNNKVYDDEKYTKALENSGSWIAEHLKTAC